MNNSIKVEGDKNMNIWKTVAIVLIALVVIGGLGFGFVKYSNAKYNSGIVYGANITLNNIASQQTSSGNVLINNGTSLTSIPITKICQNLIAQAQNQQRGNVSK